MERREFLKTCGAWSGTACAAGLPLLAGCRQGTEGKLSPLAGRKMGMVIDLDKCAGGCTACVDACRKENNVPFHGDPRWDIHWIKKVRIRSTTRASTKEKPVPANESLRTSTCRSICSSVTSHVPSDLRST